MWKKIINEIRKSENENLIKAFIEPLVPIKETELEIVIGCPSEQIIQILEKNRYITKIQEIAQEIFFKDTVVKFIVTKDTKRNIQPVLPITETKKKNIKKHKKNTSLISYYTFENFVPGPSNQTVFAASQSIAKKPGKDYNPLFIYGETGLGKTHIIQAIGNYINNLGKSVCYLSSQQLLNEYIASLSTNTIDSFRKNLLSFDILLIDDIQFLSKKTQTQNEFFHIFNEYHSTHRQIVLTSDRYPGEIKDIDDRLRSRFSWGVILDIKQPEYETRVAIVNKKVDLYKIKIEEDVIKFIAQHIKNNVREIEGALKTLQLSAELVGKQIIDLTFAENILKDIIRVKTNITVEDIIKLTSSYMRVKVTDVLSKSRTKQISLCRQIAIYLSKKFTGATLQEIGDKFGGRNHATIINSISKIEKIIIDDINIKKVVEKLEKEIEDGVY